MFLTTVNDMAYRPIHYGDRVSLIAFDRNDSYVTIYLVHYRDRDKGITFRLLVLTLARVGSCAGVCSLLCMSGL